MKTLPTSKMRSRVPNPRWRSVNAKSAEAATVPMHSHLVTGPMGLEDGAARKRLGDTARKMIRAQYDLQTICLPRQIDWVKDVMDQPL